MLSKNNPVYSIHNFLLLLKYMYLVYTTWILQSHGLMDMAIYFWSYKIQNTGNNQTFPMAISTK